MIEWAFPERNCDPPVGDINGKFQGVRLKVAGIPGRYAKIGGKNFFFHGGRGSQCKIWKISEWS